MSNITLDQALALIKKMQEHPVWDEEICDTCYHNEFINEEKCDTCMFVIKSNWQKINWNEYTTTQGE